MARYQKQSDCCPEGAEPLLVMADYKPKGQMVKIGEVDCYVAWPPEGTDRAVIHFQDIFGIHVGRHKQWCDMLAEKGYGAVAPDLFGNDPLIKNVPPYGTTCCCAFQMIMALFGGMNKKSASFSWDSALGHIVMDMIVPWMRQKGATKFATAGFCWGSYGAQHCGRFQDVFSCNASFHPSTEGVCKATKEDPLALMRAIKVPQLVVATSMESAEFKVGGAAQRAVEEGGTKTLWFNEETQKHGFMMRGDTSNPATLAAITKWRAQFYEFLAENMK